MWCYRYVLLLLTILVPGMVISQTFTWLDGEDIDYEMNPGMVKSVVGAIPDGSVWFAGMKERITSYHEMMGLQFLIQYDENGNRQEEFLIEGALVINAMEIDDAGNLYIAGDFINEDIIFWDGTIIYWNDNSLNSFLARIDSDLQIEWTMNTSDEIGPYATVSDMVFSDGELYVGFNDWPSTNVYVFDGSGNADLIISQEDVGIISGLDRDSQGNLYITGSCAGNQALFNGVSYTSQFSYNKYLVKYDPEEVPVWVNFSEDITCIFPRVKVDNEDHIYWTGDLTMECMIDDLELQGPAWVYDFFLARLDPDGEALWVTEVPEALTGDAAVGKLQILGVLPDNSVTIAGMTRKTVDWGNGYVTEVSGYANDILILNYDSNGDLEWVKTAGGDGYDNSHSLDVDADGNILITGIAHDTVFFDDQSFYTESYYYPFITKLKTDIATAISDHPGQSVDIHIVPNPVSTSALVHFTLHSRSLSGSLFTSVNLYSSTGNMIMELAHEVMPAGRHQLEVNLNTLVPGVYLMVLSNDAGKATKKVVKY